MWYKKAAAQNHSMAQCYLGECYQQGSGVARSDETAGYWFQKAADSGLKLAAERLAKLFTHFPMLKGGNKKLPPPMEYQRANNRRVEKQAREEQKQQVHHKPKSTKLPFVGGGKQRGRGKKANFTSTSIAPKSAHGSRSRGKH